MTTSIQIDRDAYEERTQQWIAEAYAAISPELHHQFDEETIDSLVGNVFQKRIEEELERDPAFREHVIRMRARDIATRALAERRPNGRYRKDGLFPVGNGKWMQMPWAKREDLQIWSTLEPEPENLRYIAKRLAAWDPAKHQTLADLERDLAEGV